MAEEVLRFVAIALSSIVSRTGGIAETASAAWVSVAIAVPIAVVLSVLVHRYQPNVVRL